MGGARHKLEYTVQIYAMQVQVLSFHIVTSGWSSKYKVQHNDISFCTGKVDSMQDSIS